MFHIAGSLLGALILSWFGFDNVVDTGMHEVFGKNISTTGYYFLFGLLGALRSVGYAFNSTKLNFNKKEN